MKFTRSLCLLALTSLAFASCSKEESAEPDDINNTATLDGTYDFLYMTAHTESDVTVVYPDETLRSLTVSDYISLENTGTYTFAGQKMTIAEVGYVIDTVVSLRTFTNGVEDDPLTLPLQYSMSGYNAVTNYKLIGADSIYIESGVSSLPDYGQNIEVLPSGSRISWSGDTLTFYGEYSAMTVDTEGGIRVESRQYLKHSTRLLKR